MAIARFYVKDNNPDGTGFPGVPLRNIEDAEWDTYPAFIQRSVDASDFFRKTPIPKAAKAEPESAKEKSAPRPAPEKQVTETPERKDET